jgi:hypothetical protein
LMADTSSGSTVATVGLSEEVLHLSPDQLSAYNLRPGVNDATFSITTQFQGIAKVVGIVYEQKCHLALTSVALDKQFGKGILGVSCLRPTVPYGFLVKATIISTEESCISSPFTIA